MKKLTYLILLCSIWVWNSKLIAQPQFFKVQIENVGEAKMFSQSGVLNTPVDSATPGVLLPGASYAFDFDAGPGTKLSFATMFVQSNDLFLAPDEGGIALYDSANTPIEGNLTSQLLLWDPGTEINEAPGVGPSQAPRQGGANLGELDPDTLVRIVNDSFAYPAIDATFQFSLAFNGGTSFTATLTNVAGDSALILQDGSTAPVIFSPGVYVLHNTDAPLFSTGTVDRGDGLEALAEDGDPAPLAEALAAKTGLTPVLSPGVFVVHDSDDPLFTVGAPDRGLGLEAIAEDGSPDALALVLRDQMTMTGGAFAVPSGAAGPGPLPPGGAYEFVIASGPTGRLSLATMFVQSNDLFYAPDGEGIALFDDQGNPISGDITDQLALWDAGTEENEVPGIGLNQAPRQGGPNTGDLDSDVNVGLVDDGYSYPDDSLVLRVTITPIQSTNFTVRIENLSTPSTLPINDTDSVAIPLSPGTWAVHSVLAPFFTPGEIDRGQGLEGIAEDGDPSAHGTWLSNKMGTPSGAFSIPVDSAGPGPLFPGAAYEFSVDAAQGTYLTLATMFVQSNDLFYAPDVSGIPMFDEFGEPISGDVTNMMLLWDAGTEADQQPGVGVDQAPRQGGADMGAEDPDTLVRLAGDEFFYPAAENVLRVTIMPFDSTTTSVTTLDLEEQGDLRMTIFPNPISDQSNIRIEINEDIELGLDIFNLLGQRLGEVVPIQRFKPGIHEMHLNQSATQSLSSGTYIVRLRNHDGILGSSIIIKN